MIWNPFVLTPTGRPVGPVAPPALRVIEGTATAEQLLIAQQANYRFADLQRGSMVPNPTEAGLLPDGSRYRIVVVGNTTIMELWPAGGGDERRSGIGVILTDLDGNALPGHTQNGVTPQNYILTPVERPGTRDTTGKWRIRKVPNFEGGKAVFQFSDRKRYLAGVAGKAYSELPVVVGKTGLQPTLNYRAYRFGNLFEGAPIFYNGKSVAEFVSDTDTLPFLRRRRNGELWIMRVAVAGDDFDRLELYGERYTAERSGPVLELLSTMDIPDGYVARWDSLSPSPDGTKLRMVFTGDGFTAVDINVGEQSLAIAATTELGSLIPGSVEHTRTGDDFNFTVWDRITSTAGISGVGYGFDAKGRGVTVKATSGARVDESTYTEEFSGSTVGDRMFEDSRTVFHTTYSIPGGGADLDGRMIRFPNALGKSDAEVSEHKEYDSGVFDPSAYTVSGSNHHRYENFTALGVLFFDPTTEFVVTAQKILIEEYTAVAVPDVGGSWHWEPPYPGGETYTDRGDVVVMCRGQTVLTIDMEDRTTMHYAVSVAADPLTGAILANLLEFTTPSRLEVRRSWLFLADDQTCRPLHEVMKIPATGVAIHSDRSLLSV